MKFSNVIVNSAKVNERREKLEELYRDFYQNNKCKYFQTCVESIHMKSYENCIYNDWSAKVDDNYDLLIDNIAVRVLIIGKEGKSFSQGLTTPSKWWPEINRHYKCTYSLLKNIFSYYPSNDEDDDILTMFTLSNTYSCAFRKYEEQKSGIRNSDVQKSNCIKLRQKEIEILEPTVIVIQYDYLHSKDLFDDAVQRDEKVYYSEMAKCYIVESSHPCCRKHPWKKNLDNSVKFLKDKGILPKILEE